MRLDCEFTVQQGLKMRPPVPRGYFGQKADLAEIDAQQGKRVSLKRSPYTQHCSVPAQNQGRIHIVCQGCVKSWAKRRLRGTFQIRSSSGGGNKA